MATNNYSLSSRRLIVGLTMAMIAAAPAHSTILFKPVGRPPEVFSYHGITISKPLANSNSLKSPRVYFIFVGPNFGTDSSPAGPTSSMIAAAKEIFGSSYLSGLTQYGSDGVASFGAFTIDDNVDPTLNPSYNPMWDETGKYLAKARYSSWLPAADGLNPPVYIVVRYTHQGVKVAGGSGFNSYGAVKGTSVTASVISVAIGSADQVDGFTWALSHELVEGMYSGTGGFAEVSPKAGSGQQICDGEPEGRGNRNYQWRLNGITGPLVTSYWSFIDQAYIIPDGKLDRELLVPVWDSDSFTGNYLSLQQGTLYLLVASDQKTPIDTQVQSFVVNLSGGTAQIFDLTSDGRVKQYSGSGTAWTTVTDSSTVASTLVSTSFLNQSESNVYNLADGQVFMLSNKKAWQYSGSGTNWNLMIANVTATAIAAANGDLYENASPGGIIQTQFVKGYITGGGTVTSANTAVYEIAAANGTLYMLAVNPTVAPLPAVWRFDSTKTSWTQVTDNATFVYRIAVAGDVLCMLATGPGVTGAIGVAQYGLTARDWIPLTGSNTAVGQILVQDGNQLYMVAANGNGPMQVWQYSAPGNWTALTGSKTSVKSASIAKDNTLHMVAANNGGPIDNWIYNGSPGNWSIVK
jgi:hypothetical protein